MVKYLSSYINDRNFCNRGCYQVSIEEAIQKYKKKYPNTKPVIVFDFMSCLAFFSNNSEILCGGRQTECTRKATLILKKFKELGVDLVFYKDGPLKREKIPHYMSRINQKYELQIKIIQNIKNDTLISATKTSNILNSYENNFCRVAKEYGKVVISLMNECDVDLAEYATNKNAVAVFSDDSDFLIMSGDWPVWSVRNFNLHNFTTRAWNKKALRESLQLQKCHMPIFASLAGNDFFKYEIVEPLIADISKGQFYNLKKVADFIRHECSDSYPTLEEVNKIVKKIYSYHKGKTNVVVKGEDEIQQAMRNSLNFYNYKQRNQCTIYPPWLKKHVEDTSDVIAFSLIKDLLLIVRQNYIDLSKNDVKPFCDLVLPPLKRLMGIILSDDCKKDIQRTVLYKPSHEEPYIIEKISPTYPDFKVPSLFHLLEPKFGVSDDEKFNVLSWVTSAGRKRLDKLVLKEIASTVYFVPALVLNYLVKSFQITVDEADVILLVIQEALASSEDKMKNLKPPEKLDERAIWISFVYNYMVSYFTSAVSICGLNKYVHQEYFDGYIFHKMYTRFLTFECSERRALIEPLQQFRLFTRRIENC